MQTLASVAFLPTANNDIDVTVTTHIEDAAGAGPSDGIISLVVSPVNDDPVVNNAIVDQNATEDSLFSFTFATDTFNDVDTGAVLTYSAQLSDGSALPSWLSFDADTRTFSGTPLNGDVGSLSIEVTADDGLGTPATDSFDLMVANTNDDPVVTNAISDQNATEDSVFSFTFATDTFTDVDAGAVLTYSAQLSDGSTLPSWLSFDADTRTFSGTPLNADVGSLSIEVTADDGLGTPATDSFDLVIANTNDDPVVTNAIADQNATEDSIFSFTFASDTFTDVDAGSVLTYSAQLSDGSALPSWLSFDADTRTFSGTPLNADVGSLSIEVTADDGLGTPATDSFNLVIANSNDDPVATNAISDQNATEDSAFSFTFTADTFSDVDAGAVLTFSAQLSDGSALPSWLNFDADTRTFSGTPLNADVGSLSIEVTAYDGLGTPATDSFDLVIANTNDDPIVTNAIADQNATEDSVFSFTFAADTFTDVDAGVTLTYSAQLSDGSALPSWLSFDAGTRTFSGTPLNADVGSLSIEVIADDGLGTPAVDSFDLVVANTNDDPALTNAIADQNGTEDSAFSFTFATDTFTDVDAGETLTYSAQLSDGSALPSWLSFDADTRTFSGTPLNADVGSLSIEVTADDGLGAPAVDSFDLVIANTNDDPVVNNEIADQNATEDSLFSFTFANDTFTDVDAGATLTYSAQLSDGSALPSWLTFDADTRTFSGTPLNADVGSLSIEVTAGDGLGGTPATDSFDLVVANTNDDPVVTNAISDQNATEDSLFSFTFSSDTFTDVDADATLTYSAQLSDGSALPSWLSFDANTRTFSGTPLNENVGSLSIEVTVDDGLGTPATDSFDLVITNTNDDPVVNNAIADQNATEDSLFSFTFATDTFTDVDAGTVLTYSAQLSDGSALPSWLSFDADTRTFSGTPLNSDVGGLSIEVTADDGLGTPATDSFNLVIANTNDYPVVTNAISDQNATEDSVFSFTFAIDTFTDVDAGAVLTYSAQLSDGSALPSWLSFDADTRTFSGTPLNGDVGSLSIEVTADDGLGTPTTDSFDLVVANTNDDPIVNNAIRDQNATEDSVFSFTFASDTFTDVDAGATLTYSAQLSDGSALPSWLSFDADTRTFSGTPLNADVGSLSIEVTADDGLGTPATDSFDLVVANTNDDPVVTNAIADQNATEDSVFTFTFASNTFTDVDAGAVLTYSAQLSDGSALPSWLSFDADTRTFSGTPLNADVGSLSIEVTADDGLGTPTTDSFDLVVANTNDDPIVNNAIRDQNATEDSVFSFTFASDTFTDVDAGATLTYSAQLSDGSALPSWLSFDADTRTFSGTPLNADVGSLSIEVTADDGLGTPATDSFDLVVANTNDDPVVTNAIADQNATEDSVFSFTFASNTFTDVDAGAVLTYSAQLSDGSALPSWLSFDADTRTFSGTPLNADVGSLSIEVTADDGLGTPTTDSFDLVVANTNDAPIVTNAIADQNATEDSVFSFTFASDTFTDVDAGATLTYSAQLSDGSTLPSWLSFDADTRTFSGTPLNADVGSLSIEVTADDSLGTPATDSFNLVIANTNDDPVVTNAIADQNATEDSIFSFTFATDTFTDVDAGAVLTYSAQLSDGSALPSWLSFDASTRTFSGTPLNADVGSLSIEVTADDGLGAPAVDSFDLVIANTNDDPVVNNEIADQNATEDSLFSFTFANDTFTDVDAGAVLTYSAQLSDGSALPSWLSFDASTRTFSGTPLNADVGSLSIEVTADDGLGAPAVDSFDLVIANTNDDPVVNNEIADQNATEDSLFSFTFANDTFTDVDAGAVLTYSAQLSDGSALPSWLSFDADTRTFSGTPLNADVGSLSVGVTADDGLGTPATDSFNLVIANTNDDPVVTNAIADQNATEDSLFSFTFANDTFTDVDAGAVLTYSAQLSDGSALPSWLSFDADTRTFSGTPTNGDVGSLSIEVTADDGLGGTVATDTFNLVIANTNDDPIVNNDIADQNATEDSVFSFTFASNTFTDVDSGAVLTYSAQLSDGSALPSWLSFDADTRTFSGTPLNADVGSLSIEVTADDGLSGTVATDTFNLVIANTNDEPVVNNEIADQNATEDSLFSFTFANDTFTEVDAGETLTYSAQLSDGSALPSWLSFDASTRTFSGTPLNGDVGSLSIEVTADDGLGTPATDSFDLLIANTNDDPVVANAIADQNATEDSVFSFTFATDTFSDVDTGSVLTYSAQLSDGSALPSWLSFDADTRTFSGTPLNSDVGGLSIEVTADDGLGTPVTDNFNLVIANTNDDPVVNNAIVDQNATEDSVFSFTFASDTFTDVDAGATLTYSAHLSDGSDLPSWLSFDANTRTYSGTPTNADVGSLSIEVTADDGLGTPATNTFNLVIANTNDDPVLTNGIADQNGTEDNAFSFTFASDTFTDVDAGAVLTYSAQLSDGSTLPSWLSFDTDTRTFSGAPLNGDVGSLSIEVTAYDGLGTPATDSFVLLIANTNDDPVVNNAIADQNAIEDSVFSFTFATDTFTDVDVGATLTYSAQLSDGSALPSWLNFDVDTRTFSGTPLNADVGSLSIEVTADDNQGGRIATESFAMIITNVNDAPVGSVIINGELSEGEFLTVDTKQISDEDGLGTFTFQWQKDGVDILGATAVSYQLQENDLGSNVSVKVNYQDAKGAFESITSQSLAIPVDDVFEEDEIDTSITVIPIEIETTVEVVTESVEEEVIEQIEEIQEIREEDVLTELNDLFQEQPSVFEVDDNQENILVIENNTKSNNQEKETLQGILEINDGLLKDNYLTYEDPLLLLQSNNFIRELDDMRQDINQDMDFSKTVVGSSLAVSAGISAGYVAWLARSGVLLSSVLSTLPMWRFIDPLPILNQTGNALEGDDESLESIVEDGSVEDENNESATDASDEENNK
ncbi:putative Ig domain-containing protein [Psychromonas sp. KJ10-10]|uniref:putative Ig domain-containing protein n=1 Tax=Psychromonas sp. KJ10-10 TaxID=3391823 RepID=UPI0039B4159A